MVLTKLTVSILNSCILYIVAAMICMVILYGPDKAYGLLYIEFLSLYEEGPGITSLIYSVFSLSAAVIGKIDF